MNSEQNSNNGSGSNAPKLTIDDVSAWKQLFLAHCHGGGYDKIVLGTIPPVRRLLLRNLHGADRARVEDKNEKYIREREQLFRLAFRDIMFAVQDHPDILKLFTEIEQPNSPHLYWNRLMDYIDADTPTTRAICNTKLMNLKQVSTVVNFITEMDSLNRKLSSWNIPVSNDMMLAILKMGLKNEFKLDLKILMHMTPPLTFAEIKRRPGACCY